jgi:hypothetical protein
VWLPGEGVVVVDRLAARRAHAIVSRLPLAPGVDPGAPPLAIAAQGEDGPVAPRPAQAWHAPYLGTRVPATVLEDARTVAPGEPFGWSLLRGDRRVAQLRGDRLVLEGPRAEIALEPLPPSP